MKRGEQKRAQMKISFGMIFSIILIIAFLVFGFYGVKFFINLQEKAKFAKFQDDFQDDIDQLWRSTQGSQNLEYTLPKGVEKVCIVKSDFSNIVFEPREEFRDVETIKLEHVDFESSIGSSKSLCFDNNDKVKISIKKEFGSDLVEIEK